MRIFSLSISAILLVAANSTTPLWGQAVANGEIAGNVTDPSGLAVANATVTATQTETDTVRSTVSSATGSYVLTNLSIGPYKVEVAAPGFATKVQRGIVLAVGSSVTIPIVLTVGSVQQQVQIIADAGMVETHDTAVSTVIDDKRVLELPLNGRQLTSLVLLSGASTNASNVGDMVSSKTYGSSNIAGSTAISIGGGQANSTNFMLDGGDNNHNYSNVNLPFPFPDAIEEFNVQTSGLSARYGLHPGGTMNVVTKSGTNVFHGDLFEFLRNSDVNARNFFAATHDSLKRNQFGGTVGGPVLKNRLFFFFGYQGTRVRSAPPQTISYVPTQAALNGDFSQLESGACQSNGRARTINNPATGQPFANATVPVSLFNPQALAITKYLPSTSNACGKITYAVPSPESEDQYIGRGDWTINSKHTLFGRYFNSGLSNPPAPFNNNLLMTSRAGLTDTSESIVVGETYTLSPTTINSLHVTGSKIRVNRNPSADDINPSTVGLNVASLAPNFLYMSISSYFNVGCGSCAPAVYASGSVQAADDVDMIRGRHHLSFGVNFIYNQLNENNVFLGNGYWTFNGQASGDGLVDFLLGVPNQYQRGNPALGNPRQDYLVFFGSTYTVNSGSIAFYNPLRIDPILNVNLETQSKGVDVVLTVTGPIDNMKLSYTSDPPLQFQEIVGLLASGKTPTSDPTLLANQPPQPRQSLAQMGESAIVSKVIADPVSNRLQRVFGITQLKVDPAFTSGSQLPTARLHTPAEDNEQCHVYLYVFSG
jgi:hypothetical protein